jgi:DNA gyrase subunit B
MGDFDPQFVRSSSSPLAPVRERPGLFVGNVRDGTGLHQLVWELVGNAVDEHLAGGASRLTVKLDGPSLLVEDDGRGLPLESFPTGPARSPLEAIFTVSMAERGPSPSQTSGSSGDGGDGASFRRHVDVSPGPARAGLLALAALAESLEVTVARAGRRQRARFSRGKVDAPAIDEGPTTDTGTRLVLVPDPEIFAKRDWDRALIEARLRTVAALNPALTVELDGVALRCPGGLPDHVAALARGATWLHAEPLVWRGRRDDVDVEVALILTDHPASQMLGFVSQVPVDEGLHIAGFWNGLRMAFAQADGGRLRRVHTGAWRRNIGRGMVAAVHAAAFAPRFGTMRGRLASSDMKWAVTETVTRAAGLWLRRQPSIIANWAARFGAAPP